MAKKTKPENSFVVLDFETTSLDIKEARIVEIACGRVADFKYQSIQNKLIKPDIELDYVVSGVNGIENTDLEKCPLSKDVLPNLLKFVKGECLVTYNAEYDLPILENEAQRLGVKWKMDKFACAFRLAHHLWPDLKTYKQTSLASFLKIPSWSGVPRDQRAAHTAAYDTLLLGEIFVRELQEMVARGMAVTIDSVCAFSKEYYDVKYMPFGKYKDMELEKVPVDYFDWMLGPKGPPDLTPDLRASIIKILKRIEGIV